MNVLRVPFRQIVAKGIRSYAAAAGHSVSAHGDKAHVEHHHGTDFKLPIATYDDLPIPRYPYQEMYNKENATFNMMLAAAFVVFVVTTAYTIYDDTFFIEDSAPPKSYRNRKIYKPTDP